VNLKDKWYKLGLRKPASVTMIFDRNFTQ